MNKELDDKASILKQKSERMLDLIERCKKYSDPQTKEMMSKWEAQLQSNNYGFEGNLIPEPPQVDFHASQENSEVSNKNL